MLAVSAYPSGDGSPGRSGPGLGLVRGLATTAKTLPDFPELWTGMLGQ